MILYLSGPMRGRPFFNFPAFATAAAALRAQGHTVLSPAEHDQEIGWSPFGGEDPSPDQLTRMMRWDLASIAQEATTAIVLLPGWRSSAGARIELLAAVACGKRVYEFELGALEDAGAYRHLRKIDAPPLFVGIDLAIETANARASAVVVEGRE